MWMRHASLKCSDKPWKKHGKKMVTKNPAKYGTLSATPKFSMSLEFVKNTPYKVWSEEDKILFWSKMP
jgi:hypothetical protein